MMTLMTMIVNDDFDDSYDDCHFINDDCHFMNDDCHFVNDDFDDYNCNDEDDIVVYM